MKVKTFDGIICQLKKSNTLPVFIFDECGIFKKVAGIFTNVQDLKELYE